MTGPLGGERGKNQEPTYTVLTDCSCLRCLLVCLPALSQVEEVGQVNTIRKEAWSVENSRYTRLASTTAGAMREGEKQLPCDTENPENGEFRARERRTKAKDERGGNRNEDGGRTKESPTVVLRMVYGCDKWQLTARVTARVGS